MTRGRNRRQNKKALRQFAEEPSFNDIELVSLDIVFDASGPLLTRAGFWHR